MSPRMCCGLPMERRLSGLGFVCIVCMGDPEIQARHAEPDDEDARWSLGYRLPRNRQEQIIAEWDAAAYQRENPL